MAPGGRSGRGGRDWGRTCQRFADERGRNRRTLCYSRGVHHPSEAASFVSRELLHREINMLAGRVAAVFISNKYFGRAARIGAEIAAAGAARAGPAFFEECTAVR